MTGDELIQRLSALPAEVRRLPVFVFNNEEELVETDDESLLVDYAPAGAPSSDRRARIELLGPIPPR